MGASDETIYALSSGRLPAAIAVVRISGPRARFALEMLARKLPEPRRAAHAVVRDPTSGEIIDDAIALWFPGPASETGEDVAEVHLHGGRAIIAAVFQVLGNVGGFRPAQAGEFTRRALVNGKLDLAAVEGLGDLIAAETEGQRRQALAQFRGALSRRVEAWREKLISALAVLEASIDFVDEGDVPEDLLTPAVAIARALAVEIRSALSDAGRGERLREGFVVAIAGPPNVGKSTLLNRLARREVAIVTDIPGTTRDPIEVALDLGGVPVVLVDTAGVRETHDPIEAEGVRRAIARAEAADLVLWLVEAADTAAGPVPTAAVQTVVVRTKSDLIDSVAQRRLREAGNLVLSAKTDSGVDQLLKLLTTEARTLAGEPALVTHARQRHALKESVVRLDAAVAAAVAGQEELVAEELRLAARTLGRVTGRVDVEDVLDEVFRNFCVGK
ncbi:MAG TPA: tRNA uridine-5-carboxymethylaminomethyl(34) synthesis GTPase MnmE [Xanthobacteraceae bacterium]|jgi:tRNA modification GTPase